MLSFDWCPLWVLTCYLAFLKTMPLSSVLSQVLLPFFQQKTVHQRDQKIEIWQYVCLLQKLTVHTMDNSKLCVYCIFIASDVMLQKEIKEKKLIILTVDIISNKARYNWIDTKYRQMAFSSVSSNPYLESLVKKTDANLDDSACTAWVLLFFPIFWKQF